jgi:hypothetical protein
MYVVFTMYTIDIYTSTIIPCITVIYMFLLHKKAEINFQITSKNSTAIFTVLTTLTYVAIVHIGKSARAHCVRSGVVEEREQRTVKVYIKNGFFKKIIYSI